MIACTLFLPIFTAAKDEKYFSEIVKSELSLITKTYSAILAIFLNGWYGPNVLIWGGQ